MKRLLRMKCQMIPRLARNSDGMALLQVMTYGSIVIVTILLLMEMNAQRAKSQARFIQKTSAVDLYSEMSLAIVNSANQLATELE